MLRDPQNPATTLPPIPVNFPRTVRQTLLPDNFFLDRRNNKVFSIVIEHLLDSLGLLPKLYFKGGLFRSFADTRLSTNQMQRFAVAQALMHKSVAKSKFIMERNVMQGKSNDQVIQLIVEAIFRACDTIDMARNPTTAPGAVMLRKLRWYCITFTLEKK